MNQVSLCDGIGRPAGIEDQLAGAIIIEWRDILCINDLLAVDFVYVQFFIIRHVHAVSSLQLIHLAKRACEFREIPGVAGAVTVDHCFPLITGIGEEVPESGFQWF